MIFHNYQKVMTDINIPQLEINNTPTLTTPQVKG